MLQYYYAKNLRVAHKSQEVKFDYETFKKVVGEYSVLGPELDQILYQ